MTTRPTLPAAPLETALSAPSLLTAFAEERRGLESALSGELSTAQTVGLVRAALDRAGAEFARTTDDPQLQKSGLWLIEVVKSGTGVLDRATRAEVAYVEAAAAPTGVATRAASWLGKPTLFYGVAGVFGLAGLVQGSLLAMGGAVGLAALHALEPKRLKALLARLPFRKTPTGIEDDSGRRYVAEARLSTDATGLVGQIVDALKTADHILMRLAAPHAAAHWTDETRLTGLLQNLLEAGQAEDTDFAMELVAKELPGLLGSGGVEVVTWSADRADLFDALPALGEGPAREMAAPALVRDDGRILRRGTVWVRD